MTESTTQTEFSATDILIDKDVAAIVRCRVTQLNRWAAEGSFPSPRKIGSHRYWLRQDVLDFLKGEDTRAKNGSAK